MAKIARKERIASPYGEIPETFSVELKFTQEQEQVLLALSESVKCVWNMFVWEYLYRLDLKKRVKEETALPSEQTKNHKGEFVWETNTSKLSLNYLIKPMRDSFHEIRSTEFSLQAGTVRKVVSSFESFFALKKNADLNARIPRVKQENEFQSLCYIDKKIRKNGEYRGSIVIEKDFVLPIPQSTLQKIGDRDIVSLEITRTEKDVRLPAKYRCSLVCYQSAPRPVMLRRVIGVDLGSTGVGIFDSRGRSYYISMRRPDFYWRPKIADLDVEIEETRKQIKLLPKESRAEAWEHLRMSSFYQRLLQDRKKMFTKMKRQYRDYHRKLAERLVHFGDIFFIGKAPIRSKEDSMADAATGDVEKNWNVQNTGSLFETNQLIAWRVKRAGKISIEVPDAKIDERDYCLRKIKQAREHLLRGLQIENFDKIIQEHYAIHGESNFENLTQHHREKIAEIVKKSPAEYYKQISVPPQ